MFIGCFSWQYLRFAKNLPIRKYHKGWKIPRFKVSWTVSHVGQNRLGRFVICCRCTVLITFIVLNDRLDLEQARVSYLCRQLYTPQVKTKPYFCLYFGGNNGVLVIYQFPARKYFPYCLFVSNSQVIGCEDRLRNDLYCVGCGVKLYSIQCQIFTDF